MDQCSPKSTWYALDVASALEEIWRGHVRPDYRAGKIHHRFDLGASLYFHLRRTQELDPDLAIDVLTSPDAGFPVTGDVPAPPHLRPDLIVAGEGCVKALIHVTFSPTDPVALRDEARRLAAAVVLRDGGGTLFLHRDPRTGAPRAEGYTLNDATKVVLAAIARWDSGIFRATDVASGETQGLQSVTLLEGRVHPQKGTWFGVRGILEGPGSADEQGFEAYEGRTIWVKGK